ncbi:MAG: efflux RND transporter periplasmic adaptor subunit, partial [Campylobacterota bacterium]
MNKIYLLALIILFFTACQSENIDTTDQNIKAVFATQPKPAHRQSNRVFSAIATADLQSKLSFKVEGNIASFNVELGDNVKKNQLLAKLDATPYEIKVTQLRYGLHEAQAQLQNYKNSFERVKKLYINDHASASDLDSAKAAYLSAQAKVRNINAQLAYAQLQLSYTRLYAPKDGTVSQKFVEESENIKAGTPVVLISDTSVAQLRVQIPQKLINSVQQGDTVQVVFDSLEGIVFEGFIDKISKYAFAKAKTYTIYIKLHNPTKSLHAGMSADVHFNFDTPKKIFYLPLQSVLKDDKGHFLYLLHKKDTHY